MNNSIKEHEVSNNLYMKFHFKRLFDIVLALFGLCVLSWLLLIIIILMKYTKYKTAGDVFFKQMRVGQHGKTFMIHKFRTMYVHSENASSLQITTSSDDRITKLGASLRKFKLDELPQLYDILIGNMSFVGPRPEVKKYIDYYPKDIKNIILSVKPGITDLASIEMIDESDILELAIDKEAEYINNILPRKLSLAVGYVQNISFYYDIKIILLTIIHIIRPSRFYKS